MKVGILGGGQLAMMMVEMTIKNMTLISVVDPSDNPPASKYVQCIKSEYDDPKILDKLIDECDVVTIDFENAQYCSKIS